MLSVPDRIPEPVGSKITEIVHPTPAANVMPQLFAEIENSPVTVGV
jgi:hypothetical protein